MNAYEIKEAVMCADLNDAPVVGRVLIADKLIDLEYELNQYAVK